MTPEEANKRIKEIVTQMAGSLDQSGLELRDIPIIIGALMVLTAEKHSLPLPLVCKRCVAGAETLEKIFRDTASPPSSS